MDLQARLSDLETKYRRLRAALVAALILPVGLVLLGQAAPAKKVVEAERFVVKDSNGIERATLGLGVHESGQAFFLSDKDGDPRIVFTSGEDGTASMVFINEDKKPQLVARVKGSGSASFELADDNGERRAKMGVGEDGGATVSLQRGRRSIAALSSSPDGWTRLTLRDREGTERARMEVGPDGATDIATLDASGRVASVLHQDVRMEDSRTE